MQLRIGEEYVKQFGKLAKGTTLVVPANLTDLASIVTMATSIARKPPAGSPPGGPPVISKSEPIFVTETRAAHSIGFLEFVVSAAATMSTQAIAIDAMLPAFPTIIRALPVGDANHGQWIVTAYMTGLGVRAIVLGRCSPIDLGCKPILLGGLTLYVVARAAVQFERQFSGAARMAFRAWFGGCLRHR